MFDKSLMCLLPVTILTVCWNIPKFFELYTCYLPENITIHINNTDTTHNQTEHVPEVCKYELRDDFNYCRDYLLIANFIVMALIPFLLLIIINTLTFRIIRISTRNNKRTSKREQRDQGIARMFVFIVLVFFFCNTPRIILNIFEVCLLRSFSKYQNLYSTGGADGYPERPVPSMAQLVRQKFSVNDFYTFGVS